MDLWAHSSVGRAPQWHCGGQGFEPLWVHSRIQECLDACRQSEWYRGTPFVSERKGFLFSKGPARSFGLAGFGIVSVDDVFIKLELTTIYGKLAGDPSQPLILGLHGWSQRNGWHTWESLMEPLADAGFCVVSIDMPGWGNSPALEMAPLAGSRAVSVVVAVLDGLQKETAVLMGKSWGGGVAIKTALDHPSRVSRLILSAPALRNFDQLSGLRQPVLLAWAEDDPVIPVAMAERYVEMLSDVQLLTYPTGGHSAAQKNAGEFSRRAIQFLHESKPQTSKPATDN
jgi:pimeloyl-ACP methyl ester carboxylesterase